MKRALVTGGSGDIGQAICHELAKLDMDILVHSNTNKKAADQVATEILIKGGRASSVCFDITNQKATQKKLLKRYLLWGRYRFLLITLVFMMMQYLQE